MSRRRRRQIHAARATGRPAGGSASASSGASPAAATQEAEAGAFVAAVRQFEEASPWLGPQHQPAVVSLRAMAAELDKGNMQPALLGQYGLAFRALSKERPTAAERDPLAAALEEASDS